jgi:cytosine/adenosine deaminase-related metal-dependent hydrolase
MAFSLRARAVFPVDRPPIEHGVVTIDGERIVAVGKDVADGEVIDLGSVALLPGLVNAHTHLEFSHLQRPLGEPGIPIADWIPLVIAERGRAGNDAWESIGTGLAESLRHGVTTIGDITTRGTETFARRSPDGSDRPSFNGPDVTQFLEVIGFSRARAESALADVMERVAAVKGSDEARIGISPHAPYTVSPDLLRRLVALAAERGLPVAMHLAESAEEVEFLARGTGPFQELLAERSMWDAEAVPRGSRPMDYLRLLAEAPHAIIIHGNYFDESEQAFLAANVERMSLVYCPRTHAYFAHRPYPLEELLAAGVRVALGTDSRASNPDLDLLAEMRYVAKTCPKISPHEIFRMGTLSGAEALGRAADVGSITPGKRANMIAVRLADDASNRTDELLAGVLDGRESARAVWSRGLGLDSTSEFEAVGG